MTDSKPSPSSGSATPGLVRTVAEVACLLDVPCPCCDGMAANGHEAECTFEDDAPDDCEGLELDWLAARELRAALKTEGHV